ncbi:MAG: reverse transcriptase family protein, partial [Desulfobacterales bacterium]|nr:reverse transcriptase family protein [Desulfobacterales bacterium]
IVSEDQTCSVPKRSILSNGHILRDLIYYAENENLPAALLSLDQMKAFDRVNWNFLFKTLESFGFGPQFISYIKTLYNNIASCVKVNGFISAPFTLERGVRQGCPLSPLLYIIVSEIFAISVRKNKNITGITIKNVEFKITQYADDTTIILQGEKSITSTFDCVQDFEMASGAKINKEKSKGIWLGLYEFRSDNPFNLKWGREALKILGVYHGPVFNEKDTWEPRINKFIKTLDLWTSRDLSLRGRAVVANQLASSVFWYTAAIYPIPQWALKKINDRLWKFIYQNKKDPIKRTQARLPYELGGLNIIDIEKKADAIKLSWISKYLQNDNKSKWKTMFNFYFDRYRNFNIGAKIFKCYLRPKEMNNAPLFYRNVLKCFGADFSQLRLKVTDIESIYNEPLFDNFYTHVDTSNAWIEAKITTIRDICYEFTPGFLPSNAIEELVSPGFFANFYSKLKSRLPAEWKAKITTECSNERSLSDDF